MLASIGFQEACTLSVCIPWLAVSQIVHVKGVYGASLEYKLVRHQLLLTCLCRHSSGVGWTGITNIAFIGFAAQAKLTCPVCERGAFALHTLHFGSNPGDTMRLALRNYARVNSISIDLHFIHVYSLTGGVSNTASERCVWYFTLIGGASSNPPFAIKNTFN